MELRPSRPKVQSRQETLIMEMCTDCKEDLTENYPRVAIPLNCCNSEPRHFICILCLKKRAEPHPEIFKCAPCNSGIYMFVDDSNIWIAAKELVSKTRKYKTGEDHRVRIDMGKLADVLADGRQIRSATLYGSVPPPIDTVWQKVKENGWNVICKDRSSITGKEKQVDTQLAVDITKTALKPSVGKQETIIIVTGDADVIPALDVVVGEEAWNIELYMWRHTLSSKIQEYAKKYDTVVVRHLDSYLENITFTNMIFQISNPEVWKLVCDCGIVFSMEPNAFPTQIPSNWWIKQIESIAQWPFQFFWHNPTRRQKTPNILVLVFKPDRVAGKFDRQRFLEEIQNYPIPHVNDAHTFQKYDPNKMGHFQLEQIGFLSEDDLDTGYDYLYCQDEYGQEVNPKPRSCWYGKHCRNGVYCRFLHSDAEKEYFRRQDGRGNPYRKVKPCKYLEQGHCWKTKEECDGAHGEEDAFCLACKRAGHYTKNCPYKD